MSHRLARYIYDAGRCARDICNAEVSDRDYECRAIAVLIAIFQNY